MLNTLKKLFSKQTPSPQTDDSDATTANNIGTTSSDTVDNKKRHKKNTTKNKSYATKKKSPSKIESTWQLSEFEVPLQEGKLRFHDLNLATPLLHAIHDLGFSYCTPIQSEVLTHTLQGHDCIGQAQTGTGKTAAFLITIISQLESVEPPSERYMGEPRALIIAPTRELVIQIAEEAKTLTKYSHLNVMSFVGGMDFNKQLKQLESMYCDILVATPGRLLDFQQRNEVYLDMVEILVLDEADRMLDMGFIPQVKLRYSLQLYLRQLKLLQKSN